MRKLVVIVLLVVAAPAPEIARADDTPRTGVVDRVGVMNSGEMQQLNAWLLELEQKTGAQLKVLIVPSTDGRDIYSYAIDTARKWRLGQKGKNNGALVVVAVKDKKYYTVTGEGIEHALPDLLCDQIAQTYFVPNFRRGDYSHGIFLGTIEMARAIAKDSGVELGGLPAQQQGRHYTRRDQVGSGCFAMIVPIVVILLVVGSMMSRANRMNRGMWGHGRRRGFSPGSFFAGMLLNSLMNSSSRGGWSSGGSSWGGGSDWGGGGGFGGGGGGSFGGGGSGGSW